MESWSPGVLESIIPESCSAECRSLRVPESCNLESWIPGNLQTDWIGMAWDGLGWIGMDSNGFDWIGMNLDGFGTK